MMVKKPQPTALAAFVFAGGFTAGVKAAGFDVLAHFEGSDYGVSSALLNFPDMPIHYGFDQWPMEEYAGKVDFLYCNPPCAIWSSMGIATTRGKDAWRTDPRTECWHNVFRVFEVIQPAVFAVESVCQAYTTGRSLMDDLTRRAIAMGYSVTHLLVDAQWHGIPQVRKRFFFVAHRAAELKGLDIDYDAPQPVIGDALDFAADDPGEYFPHEESATFKALLPYVGPGDRFVNVWNERNPEPRELNPQGKVKGRPSFQDRRLEPSELSGAFIGNRYFHPTIDRRLGLNEMKAICGYPPDFQLDGNPSGFGSMLARAVMPPVATFLARAAIATLAEPTALEPIVTCVDLRKPGIPPVVITHEYDDEPEEEDYSMTDEHEDCGCEEQDDLPLDDQPVIGPPDVPTLDRDSIADRIITAAAEAMADAVMAIIREGLAGLTGMPRTPKHEPDEPISVIGADLEDPPTTVESSRTPEPEVEKKVVPIDPGTGNAPPYDGEGSGRYIQRLWMTGLYSPDRIVEKVHEHYEGRTTSRSDVYYNYKKLVDSGTPDVPPWPSKKKGGASAT